VVGVSYKGFFMARIRTIKPEFFTSADIVSLTPLSRLFYVSLWCEADREGRLNWNIKTLKMRYFPADNCNIEKMASELIDVGLIKIYEIDGRQYAVIPSFKHHQVINNRESESIIPDDSGFYVDVTLTRESGVQGEGRKGRERKEGKGRERKGKEDAICDDFILPDWIDADTWNAYMEVRQEKKAVQSSRAINMIISSLEKMKEKGIDVNAAISESVKNSWKDVYEPRTNNNASQPKESNLTAKLRVLAEMARE
jgi:hypothetical protein